MQLQTIPHDVLLEITTHLSRAHVLNLALTSSRLLANLLPILYASVTLNSSEQCVTTLRMLREHPEVAQEVRKLILRPAARSGRNRGDETRSICALVVELACLLLRLRAFEWDADDLPPDDHLWSTLRRSCPHLRYIGSSLGAGLCNSGDEFVRFTDLHGFAVTFKPTFPQTFNDPMSRDRLRRLSKMIVSSCPHLKTLRLHGATVQALDFLCVAKGHWEQLEELSIGDVFVDWSTAQHGEHTDSSPFSQFITLHPSLVNLHLRGATHKILQTSDIPTTALTQLRNFTGPFEHVMSLPNRHRLCSVEILGVVNMDASTSFRLPGMLQELESLTCLTISFDHNFKHVDDIAMLKAIETSCRRLVHLNLTCGPKSACDLNTFSRNISQLWRLRSFTLRLPTAAQRRRLVIELRSILDANPRLRDFSVAYGCFSEGSSRDTFDVKRGGSFEVFHDKHGLPITVRGYEHRKVMCYSWTSNYTLDLRPRGHSDLPRMKALNLLLEPSVAGDELRMLFLSFCLVVLSILFFFT